jgi:hypothetical protein
MIMRRLQSRGTGFRTIHGALRSAQPRWSSENGVGRGEGGSWGNTKPCKSEGKQPTPWISWAEKHPGLLHRVYTPPPEQINRELEIWPIG